MKPPRQQSVERHDLNELQLIGSELALIFKNEVRFNNFEVDEIVNY